MRLRREPSQPESSRPIRRLLWGLDLRRGSMAFLRRTPRLAILAIVGTLMLAVHAPLQAQTTSASVSGLVKDSQGGALPGASVTLTSRTQGGTLTTLSDSEGRFVFAIVRPDAYTLKVTMAGFKTLERANVVVNANDKFSAGVLALS